MVTSPIAQSITRRAALAGAAGVALAGCANNPSGESAPANGESKVPRRNPASEPVTTISTAHGLAAMWPDEPIDIEVTEGTLAGVVVTDAAGEPVPGSVQDGQWRPDRGALLVRSSYQVTATATDAAGRSHQTAADISTVNPELVVEVDFRYADGAPVGNGMPIWVRFDMPIRHDQRAAIEKTATVTTNPPQQGGWGWVDETTLQWRPRTYWEPGSTAHVEVNAAGLPGGDTWVLADASADYLYGDLRVLQANIDTNTLTCLRNGEVVQIMPVSMGKPGYETMTGTKIIMEKQNPVIMDSESYGCRTATRRATDHRLLGAAGDLVGRVLPRRPVGRLRARQQQRQPRLHRADQRQRRVAVQLHPGRRPGRVHRQHLPGAGPPDLRRLDLFVGGMAAAERPGLSTATMEPC